MNPGQRDVFDPPSFGQGSLAVLRAEHQRANTMFSKHARLTSDTTNPADRQSLLSSLSDCLITVARLEQELLYPRLASVLDSATLNAARYSHRRIEQHMRALNAQPDDGPGTMQRIRNLQGLVRAHQTFEERRLFGPAEQIDSPALCAQLTAMRDELQDGTPPG